MLKTRLCIGTGSFIGGVARYLIARALPYSDTFHFPMATLLINVAGCLLIGVVNGLLQRGDISHGNLYLFLTVGFCGGFTTFSTFVNENYNLFTNERFLHFLLYATLSFALGLLAAHLGYRVTNNIH